MTKRRSGSGPTRIELNRYRLNRIATQLTVGMEMGQEDRDWLALALMQVAYGGDANAALEVKAGSGERDAFEAQLMGERMTRAMAWIAAAIAPSNAEELEDRGLGLSLSDALDKARKLYGVERDTLENHWKAYPEKRTRSFAPPLSAGPVIRKRGEPDAG